MALPAVWELELDDPSCPFQLKPFCGTVGISQWITREVSSCLEEMDVCDQLLMAKEIERYQKTQATSPRLRCLA